MKKIKVMVILILMICSLFTACGNSDTEVNKDKDNSNVNIVEMKNYNKTFDNIIFDTEIIVDKKDKNKPFFSSSASPQKVDNKKVFMETNIPWIRNLTLLQRNKHLMI